MQPNLIEIIRRGEMEKSLKYAQENLSNDNTLTDSQLERLEKTFALWHSRNPRKVRLDNYRISVNARLLEI
ncbi:hypothetical protein GCK32_011321 [Trichostrongylus colubriformis]|uniref:CTLH/CRA C-terminal to LisH motif domain-containing protein n=1 Tax=Trichostrongylus colubriformis TaxID=6319 RepID=A0AAN8FF81_TRICO